MKILAMIHGYPEMHNSGAEWMIHEMLKRCIEAGHSATVMLPLSERLWSPYKFEGVNVVADKWPTSKEIIKEHDIIISHLNRAGHAWNSAEFFGKPYVFVVHNSNYSDFLNVKGKKTKLAYVIYNTEFTENVWKLDIPSMIVHPPVDAKRYQVTFVEPIIVTAGKKRGPKKLNIPAIKGNKITLINLFHRKGSKLFYEIARQLPDKEFLGVEGAYGEQIKENLPNVSFMPNTSDMRQVYSQTKILLMPSEYESYGRTGVEAICSGIPVIASDLKDSGLNESLGDAGIYCSRDSVSEWVEAIKRLDDETEYKSASEKALKRFEFVNNRTKEELDKMVGFLDDIKNRRI